MLNQQQQQQLQLQQQQQNPQQQLLDGPSTEINATSSISPSFALSPSTSTSLPPPPPLTSLPVAPLPTFPSGEPAHAQQRLQLQRQHLQALLQLQNLQIRQRKRLDEQQPDLHSQPFRSDSFSVQDPQISDAFTPSSSSDGFLQYTSQDQAVRQQGTSIDPHHSRPEFSLPISVSVNTSPGHIDSNPILVSAVHRSPSTSSLPPPFLGFTKKSLAPPQLISTPVATTTSSMDIMAMFPPLAPHNSFSPNSTLLLQDPIQLTSLPNHDQKEIQLKQQQLEQLQLRLRQQQEQAILHQHHLHRQQVQQHPLNVAPYYNPLKCDGMRESSHHSLSDLKGLYSPDGVSRNQSVSSGSTHDILRGLSSVSGVSDQGTSRDAFGYSIDARIIQKKDQMDRLLPNGGLVPTSIVDEVRTGQQFLIRLQLSKPGVPPTPTTSSSNKFPTMRVDRREAINTAGEPRADVEPLTLQIVVHLAKSGQIRKGACAKCCHKYGPSSPILVLLDPLSPSATDPTNFAHVDTSTGAVTMLAKVVCSSTDHSERGNKDQYKFEFRLKRTSSRLEEDEETLATCLTSPIMCSGHHKAKRAYPQQRPLKCVDTPSPKTKIIKRHKSPSSLSVSSHYRPMYSDQALDEIMRSSSISSTTIFPSPMAYIEQLPSSNIPNDSSEHDHSHRYQRQSSASNDTLTNNGHLLDPSQCQAPRVMDIRPNHGPIRKTTDVVLRGLYFREGMVPYFGCFPAQDIVVETANLILCKAPESPLPGTVAITIYDTVGTSYTDLSQFTYTDDSETELLILQLQLRMAHRALEYLHTKATGQRGSATEILREIPDMGSSPRSGGGAMDLDAMSMTEVSDGLLTREQVEEGILRTLDQLPLEMDISLQIDQQGNLLHLSILMGFDKLAKQLIADGCDIEALDAWSMTPLMYAVVQGNETIVRELVLAGATTSGAQTTQEFFASLPRVTAPTPAVLGYLSLSCTRFSSVTRTLAANTSGLPDMVEIEYEDDEGETSEQEDQGSETQASESSSQQTLLSPSAAVLSGTTAPVIGEELMTRITENIAGVYLNHDMPPLGQQDLPRMQTTLSDGSIEVNTKVFKGVDIAREFAGVAAEQESARTEQLPVAQVRQESGYQSGVYSEVQDRLNELKKADLPSEGIEMTVKFIKPPTPPTVSAIPANLFRTGDTFDVQVRLTVLPGWTESELPREYLGLRFPQELVKRASGMAPSLLNEMTYILKMSIELGKASSSSSEQSVTHDHHHQGDGIVLDGACQACSKYLLQTKKLLPGQAAALANPASYPILQFVIPGSAPTVATSTGEVVTPVNSVMEVRDGLCDVRARVNCSSLHHLVQREKAKRMVLLRRQQQERGETSVPPGSPSKGKMALDMSDLEDPGFVFSFELVHPTLHSVVARTQVGPLNFQSYSLKK